MPHLGTVVALGPDGGEIAGQVPAGHVYVDGLTIGDVGDVVLRDRQTLARDGVLFVTVTVDRQTGELVAGPDITSRGFVLPGQADELFDAAKGRVREALRPNGRNGHGGDHVDRTVDWNYLNRKLRDVTSTYIWEQTRRRPMILPLVVEA